jgi:hypothetical protein
MMMLMMMTVVVVVVVVVVLVVVVIVVVVVVVIMVVVVVIVEVVVVVVVRILSKCILFVLALGTIFQPLDIIGNVFLSNLLVLLFVTINIPWYMLTHLRYVQTDKTTSFARQP